MLQNLKLLKVYLKYQLGQILQQTLRNYHWSSFGTISKKSHKYLKRWKKLLYLSTIYLYKAGFSLYMSAKTTHHNRFYTEVEDKIPAVLS